MHRRAVSEAYDHPMGFKSLLTARNTISGIELMHMVRKGQVDGIQCVLSEVEFFNKIMRTVA